MKYHKWVYSLSCELENWMFVPWILVLTWKKILPRVGQDFFHPPSHCRMPFHPHDRKNVFITWLEPKPQRSLGRLLRTLRARALPPHGLTTLRPPSAAWGCKGLPKQFIREIMARTVTPTKIKVLNSLFFLKKNWRVKVDSTTAYVLVWEALSKPLSFGSGAISIFQTGSDTWV